MKRMKALSVWQPWAQLIVLGEKKYETRGRATKIRGRIAIQAAKKAPWQFITMPIIRVLEKHRFASKFLPRGEIIGTVEIVDCEPVEQMRGDISESEYLFGDYSNGRYAWALANPVMFDKPIPCKGRQGFWEVEI